MILHGCSVQNLARSSRLRFGGIGRTNLRRWRNAARRLVAAGLLCTVGSSVFGGEAPVIDRAVIPVAHSSVKVVDDKSRPTATFVDGIPINAPTADNEADSTARFLTGNRAASGQDSKPHSAAGPRTLIIDSVRARVLSGKRDDDHAGSQAEPSVDSSPATAPANGERAKPSAPEDRKPATGSEDGESSTGPEKRELPTATIVTRPKPSTNLRRDTLPTTAPELISQLDTSATVAGPRPWNSGRHSLARDSQEAADYRPAATGPAPTNDRLATSRTTESPPRSPVVNFLRNILPHESKENVMWGPANRHAHHPASQGRPPHTPQHFATVPAAPSPQTFTATPQAPSPSPPTREIEVPRPRTATSRVSADYGVATPRNSDGPRLARRPEPPTLRPEKRAVEERPTADASDPAPAAPRSVILRPTSDDDRQTPADSPTSHDISDTISSRRDNTPNKVRRISVKEMIREQEATEELRKPSSLRVAPRPAASPRDQSQHETSRENNQLANSDESRSDKVGRIRTVSHETTDLPQQRSAPEVRFVVLQPVDQSPPHDEAPVPPNTPSIPTAGNDSLRPIGDVQANIRAPEGEFPLEPAEAKFAQFGTMHQPMGTNRPWSTFVVNWEAAALCHGGLAFEEVNLERYGYSHGLAQPFLSAAHFFGRVPALPYLTIAEKPHGCIYTLGHYRPGSWAPYQRHLPPFSPQGALGEAATIAGLILLIP